MICCYSFLSTAITRFSSIILTFMHWFIQFSQYFILKTVKCLYKSYKFRLGISYAKYWQWRSIDFPERHSQGQFNIQLLQRLGWPDTFEIDNFVCVII